MHCYYNTMIYDFPFARQGKYCIIHSTSKNIFGHIFFRYVTTEPNLRYLLITQKNHFWKSSNFS